MPSRKYALQSNHFSQLINDQVISQELPDLVKEIEATLAES